MKPLIIGVHGFNSDGNYINQLEKYFVQAGYDFQPFIYGKAARTTLGNIIANRWRTKKVFNELAQVVINTHRDIILVGHSHGLRLSWGVQNVCGNVKGIIAFNGCLDTHINRECGKNVMGCKILERVPIPFKCWVINCYCRTDYTLKVGAKFRPFSKWGDYGARQNPNATNIDLANYGVKGHSDFLEYLDKIMPDVIARIPE